MKTITQISSQKKCELFPLIVGSARQIGIKNLVAGDVARLKQEVAVEEFDALGIWAIPNTAASYAAFKKLGIPYLVSKQSVTRQALLGSETSRIAAGNVASLDGVKEGRKQHPNIVKGNRLHSIVWNAGYFFIRIAYSEAEVTFLKCLRKAYWDKKQRHWVCVGSTSNLHKLQKRYYYWNALTFEQLLVLCGSHNSKRVEVKAVGHQMAVTIVGIDEVVRYLKTLSHRTYCKKGRYWLVPKREEIYARIQSICLMEGVPVTNKIAWNVEQPNRFTRDKKKWLSYFLTKSEPKNLEVHRSYLTTLIGLNYGYTTAKQYFNAFVRFSDAHDADISELRISEISAYINAIALKGVNYQELNRHISAIKFYYKHVCNWSEIRLEGLERPKKARTLPTILAKTEVKRMFASVHNVKHLTMLYLAYGCGLRAGEVVYMKTMHLDFERKMILISSGKGKKDRMVPLPLLVVGPLTQYIKEYRPDYWLFPGADINKPYSHSSLRAVFKRACARAGITKQVKLHNLRHSYATHLMESGTQLQLIQKLLGHKSAKTTEIYTLVSKESIKEIQSPLDNLDIG